LTYQQEVDKRGQEELESQLKRFKENESAQIRVEAQAHARRELTSKYQEMEQKFAERNVKLQKQEQDLQQQYQRKLQEADAAMYDDRQKLLVEMERLRIKDDQMKHSLFLETRSNRLESKRLGDMEKVLDDQRAEIKNLTQKAQEDCERQLRVWKEDFRSGFKTREEELRHQKADLDFATDRLNKERLDHSTELSRYQEVLSSLHAATREKEEHLTARKVLADELPQLRDQLQVMDLSVPY
jgi:oral-facial-digital syndrome 1 protein